MDPIASRTLHLINTGEHIYHASSDRLVHDIKVGNVSRKGSRWAIRMLYYEHDSLHLYLFSQYMHASSKQVFKCSYFGQWVFFAFSLFAVVLLND